MAEGVYRGPGDEIPVLAWEDTASGTVVQYAGMGAIIDGQAGVIHTGDPITLRVKGRASLASASGTTFTAGDAVQWDNTTKLAVATGDFAVGKAAADKGAGTTEVYVLLNE